MKNPKFWIEKSCAVCSNRFWSLISRDQKTCSARCSGVYVAQQPGRIDKIRNTKLTKYGSATYVNTEKARQTCLKKYGVENVSKSPQVVRRIKETNQKKRGVDWAFQSEDVKGAIKNTNLVQFGVEHVSQRTDVKVKKSKTFVKKYGVENPFQSEDIKEQVRVKNLQQYGVEYASQRPDVQRKIRNNWKRENFDDFIANHKLNEHCIPLFDAEEYVNTDKEHRYKFRCKKCGDVFEDHIDGGHLPRCMKCFPYQLVGDSESEREIVDFVKTLTADHVVENTRTVLPSGRELDIYIPSKKFAIEFDGLYWHSELAGKAKRYHLSKTEECESLGIHLIHVFEDEWKLKKDIIKSKIRSKFDTTKRIGARQLVIGKVPAKEKNEFLQKYHVQGKDGSSICYGAWYKDELVAVITFGKQRIALGGKSRVAGTYELVRFATSRPLVGVMQKFFKVFRQEHAPKKIISYADRRFTSTGRNIYDAVGMRLVSKSLPNYWYFKNGTLVRFHRFGFRKQTLKKRLGAFDETLTEWQNMKNGGYNRIWDCGSLKYELDFL